MEYKIHKAFTISGKSIAIVIPLDFAEKLGIKDGTYVRIDVLSDHLTLTKVDGNELRSKGASKVAVATQGGSEE